MKDIKIIYGKTGLFLSEDIKSIETKIQEKVNEGYKIVSSNMTVSNNVWIYAIMEKEI